MLIHNAKGISWFGVLVINATPLESVLITIDNREVAETRWWKTP